MKSSAGGKGGDNYAFDCVSVLGLCDITLPKCVASSVVCESGPRQLCDEQMVLPV